MNPESNPAPESFGSQGSTPTSTTRPMYWSIARELWENRSIYVAPLAAASVIVAGFLLSAFRPAHRMSAVLALPAAQQSAVLAKPYSFAAIFMMLVAILVSIFYSLDALHGERRDRSILFWKSLPVSDLTTVLSKESIPVIVLPLLVFAVTVAMQLLMVLISTVALLLSGNSPTLLWSRLPLFEMELVLFYGLTVHAIWQAPLYAWLLLVSGWARRMAFLWAVAPLVVIAAIGKIAFGTSHIGGLLNYIFFGGCMHAFDFHMREDVVLTPLSDLTPGKFLLNPGLWLGLTVAAGLLVAAARLRRQRGPI